MTLLSDLRARVVAGEALSDDEIIAAVRALRDNRAAAVERAAVKARAKHVDMDKLFAGVTPEWEKGVGAAPQPTKPTDNDPFR